MGCSMQVHHFPQEVEAATPCFCGLTKWSGAPLSTQQDQPEVAIEQGGDDGPLNDSGAGVAIEGDPGLELLGWVKEQVAEAKARREFGAQPVDRFEGAVTFRAFAQVLSRLEPDASTQQSTTGKEDCER